MIEVCSVILFQTSCVYIYKLIAYIHQGAEEERTTCTGGRVFFAERRKCKCLLDRNETTPFHPNPHPHQNPPSTPYRSRRPPVAFERRCFGSMIPFTPKIPHITFYPSSNILQSYPYFILGYFYFSILDQPPVHVVRPSSAPWQPHHHHTASQEK